MTLQDALSDFIGEGYYAAHIRKMTRVYYARRDHLFHALRTIETDLTVSAPDGGIQVLVQLGPLHGAMRRCAVVWLKWEW